MPSSNEHSVRVNDPDKYDEIKRQNDKFGEGIHVSWGIIKGPPRKSEVQSIKFDAKKFTIAQAKRWLKDHDYKYKAFEAATKESKQSLLKEENRLILEDKVLIRVGTFNDIEFTEEALKAALELLQDPDEMSEHMEGFHASSVFMDHMKDVHNYVGWIEEPYWHEWQDEKEGLQKGIVASRIVIIDEELIKKITAIEEAGKQAFGISPGVMGIDWDQEPAKATNELRFDHISIVSVPAGGEPLLLSQDQLKDTVLLLTSDPKILKEAQLMQTTPSIFKDIEPVSSEIYKSEQEISEGILLKTFTPFTKIITEGDYNEVEGVVLVPDQPDRHGHTFTKEAIKKAHDLWMLNYQQFSAQHMVKGGYISQPHMPKELFNQDLMPLSSYVTPVDICLNDQYIPAGSWILRCAVKDKHINELIKQDLITGYSLGCQVPKEKEKPPATIYEDDLLGCWEVSLVNRGANGRQFYLYKSEEVVMSDPKDQKTPDPKDTSTDLSLQDVLERLSKFETRQEELQKTQEAKNAELSDGIKIVAQSLTEIKELLEKKQNPVDTQSQDQKTFTQEEVDKMIKDIEQAYEEPTAALERLLEDSNKKHARNENLLASLSVKN